MRLEENSRNAEKINEYKKSDDEEGKRLVKEQKKLTKKAREAKRLD